MPSKETLVRAIAATDRAAWFGMWSAYCAFYEVTIPDSVSQTTWRRLIADDAPISGLVAVSAATGAALGFANYVVHPFTWSERPACYLEDLFVRPDARSSGVGRALIERLVALCKAHQWSRLYWMTRETNEAARRLYDQFGRADDFVRYDIPIEPPLPEVKSADFPLVG